jgi:hypothetical protein
MPRLRRRCVAPPVVLTALGVTGAASGHPRARSTAVARSSRRSATALIARANAIVTRLHAQGVLRRASPKYFHTDFASRANHFDVSRLKQKTS